MRWSAERVDLLTRLWLEGYSASQIAETLGDNTTRNAVIGKAHRLNLQRGTVRKVSVPTIEPARQEKVVVHPMVGKGLEPWMCRWPTDEPGKYGLHICGATVQPGRKYCAEHCTYAYMMRKQAGIAA